MLILWISFFSNWNHPNTKNGAHRKNGTCNFLCKYCDSCSLSDIHTWKLGITIIYRLDGLRYEWLMVFCLALTGKWNAKMKKSRNVCKECRHWWSSLLFHRIYQLLILWLVLHKVIALFMCVSVFFIFSHFKIEEAATVAFPIRYLQYVCWAKCWIIRRCFDVNCSR